MRHNLKTLGGIYEVFNSKWTLLSQGYTDTTQCTCLVHAWEYTHTHTYIQPLPYMEVISLRENLDSARMWK